MIKLISGSEYTTRAHTIPFIKEQSLASHMGRSAMLLILFYRKGKLALDKRNYYRVLEYLILHDLHESDFGDIPYTTKLECNLHDKECEAINSVLQSLNLKDLPERLKKIADWFDLLEFYLKTCEEVQLGNRTSKC